MDSAPTRPVNAAEMAELRRHAKLMGPTFDLDACARRINRSRQDTNLMLDALLGRTPVDAAAALNGGGHGPVRVWPVRHRMSRGLRAFFKEVFDER